MKRTVFALIVLALSHSAQAATPVDTSWLPVSDAEMKMKSPQVEKDAGVEAIFWRVHVLDEFLNATDLQRTLYHYVRLKVFDEKGKAKAATIEIPFSQNESVLSVSGRTIKEDGTILELKKDSIFQRDQVRVGSRRRKVVAFAMPGVEPGVIVEYRWHEVRFNPGTLSLRLQFQLEYPVQKVTYFMKPLPRRYTTASMQVWPFNCKPSAWEQGSDGYVSTSVDHVPAFRPEPMMPGEPNVRPWALIFYTSDSKREVDKYWNDIGKNTYNQYLKPAIKINDEVRSAAAEAIGAAKTDEDKVAALIRYIRENVRDLYGRQVSEVERTKIIKDRPKDRYRTSAEVLKSGIGDSIEVNMLLAAMATSAGLEARPALVADRENFIFDPKLTERYFLPYIDMAVNVGGKWKVYDASARLLPASMISWREEGMKALLCESKTPAFIESPVSPPMASRAIRTADFRLQEDGQLEGDVSIAYTGHLAFLEREAWEGDTDARKLEKVKEDLNKVFPDAEVSDEKIENANNPEIALKVHYHIKLAGFAQRTGKRLLFRPFYFQIGSSPLFSESERHFDVVFPYAWNEYDTVNIKLPEGFQLDNADNPGSLNIGKPGSYSMHMALSKNHELLCSRTLVFGDAGLLGFPKQNYPAVKTVFDEINRRDSHMISLKQTTVADKQ